MSDIELAIAEDILPDIKRTREGFISLGYNRGPQGPTVWLYLPLAAYGEVMKFLTEGNGWHEFTLLAGDKAIIRRDLVFEVTSASPEAQAELARERLVETAWLQRRGDANTKPPWQ